MGLVFGFGCTEEQVRHEVKEALASEGREALKRWNDKANEYDKLSRQDAPERYTRVFCYGNKIVFFHINRRHPFSPDGWALMEIEEPY